jgi:hypothetical protein
MLAHPPQPGTSRRVQVANILERMIALYDELADENYSKIEDYEYEIGDVMSVEPQEQNVRIVFICLDRELRILTIGVCYCYWLFRRRYRPPGYTLH